LCGNDQTDEKQDLGDARSRSCNATESEEGSFLLALARLFL
jgi:hypothetical protein